MNGQVMSNISGIGMDLVEISGFRAQLAEPGSSFVAGTFTAGEQAASQGRASKDPTQYLAARYAAKEAFIKAWSGGFWGKDPILKQVDMREIEVQTDGFGRPRLVLHGAMASAVGPFRAHLSMTHDGPMAGATVILERGDANPMTAQRAKLGMGV